MWCHRLEVKKNFLLYWIWGKLKLIFILNTKYKTVQQTEAWLKHKVLIGSVAQGSAGLGSSKSTQEVEEAEASAGWVHAEQWPYNNMVPEWSGNRQWHRTTPGRTFGSGTPRGSSPWFRGLRCPPKFIQHNHTSGKTCMLHVFQKRDPQTPPE